MALGCLMDCEEAVASIFSIKNRQTNKPLPLAGCSLRNIGHAVKIDKRLLPLLRLCWPGPINVLLEGQPGLSPLLKNSDNQCAIRISSDKNVRKLACKSGRPLIATSANISCQPPPLNQDEISRDLIDQMLISAVPAALAIWPARNMIRKPSTLVEFNKNGGFRILREGQISKEILAERCNSYKNNKG